MNSWITRGLQNAVLSGGMWALGAGIASADTLVANPPGTSLISVPITANQNSLGRLGTAPDSSTAGTNGALINVPVTVCGNGVVALTPFGGHLVSEDVHHGEAASGVHS